MFRPLSWVELSPVRSIVLCVQQWALIFPGKVCLSPLHTVFHNGRCRIREGVFAEFVSLAESDLCLSCHWCWAGWWRFISSAEDLFDVLGQQYSLLFLSKVGGW